MLAQSQLGSRAREIICAWKEKQRMPERAMPAAEVRERFECLEERVGELEGRSGMWDLLNLIMEMRQRLQALEGKRQSRGSRRSRKRKSSR